MSCYPSLQANYNQRMWSFMRIVETVDQINNLLTFFPKNYKKLYISTLKLKKKSLQKYEKHDYTYFIKRYYTLLKQKIANASPSKIANAYSLASFIEKDSYRSIGAILHIVEKVPNISIELLYDSIYDNLGFVYNILYTNSLCLQEQLIIKFIKICKYIYRITDAMILINSNISNIVKQIHHISNDINEKRKQMIRPSLLEKDVMDLLALLNISELSKPIFITTFTKFIIDNIPKDPLLP